MFRSIIVVTLLAGTVAVATAGPWPEVKSDLPVDPALHTGQLPNGLRFLILPNAEPKDRVSLRLVVAAGSLQEGSNERGLAHFVEHMAFRGTRTHPAGSLIGALQRLGLGMGPDVAAFTNYDHTIYHLELPDPAEATLREGLGIFREYAAEVTFDPALLELERGVVLNEKSTRNTPESRVVEANLQFLFPDSRHARRAVIGLDTAIRTFSREQFVAFYDTWYRPERMAVIVVGAVDPAVAERLIAAVLGPLEPRGPPGAEPPDLDVPTPSKPDVVIYADRGLAGVGLRLEHAVLAPQSDDTHARRLATARSALAFSMTHERLQKLSHDTYAGFVSPIAQLTGFLPNWQVATIAASARIDDWQRLAADLEREHRRAIQHGFTAAELTAAQAAFALGFEESVRASGTRNSAGIAANLADGLVHGRVFTTPVAQRDDLAAAVAATTLDECEQAFRDAWTFKAPHVLITANPAFGITREQIAATLNQSRTTAAAAPAPTAVTAKFAYENFGPTGTLVHDELVADLDVHLARFANGVRLNFKSTQFSADEVDIHLRVGCGKLNLPKNQPGLDLLAEQLLPLGGLGQHTATDLRQVLAGHAVRYGFSVESDALVFRCQCARRDLRLCLQVVTAYLTDAAYRPEAIREVRANFGSLYSSLSAAPSGPISMLGLRELTGGDARFGIATPAEMEPRTTAELIAWLEPQLKGGAIELSIVGDVAWDEASASVASTLGALRTRTFQPLTSQVWPVALPSPRGATKYFGIDPQLKQSTIACYWPVAVCKDNHQERRSVLLAEVMTERLRARLRDELGASYVSHATFIRTGGFPAFNYFLLQADVDQPHAQQALDLIKRETAALAKTGPTADEFERAKKPYLNSMQSDLRTNVYWGVTVLSDVQQRPENLASARDRATDIATITLADLTALAKQHLQPANALTLVTAPVLMGAPPRK